MKADAEVLKILAEVTEASLGTVEADGRPYVSSVGVLYEPAQNSLEETGQIFLFLSALARHTRNLAQNPSISLLFSAREEKTPVHETARLTVQGEAALVANPVWEQKLRTGYLQRFPRSEIFLSLPDFRFYEVRVREIHWIGGFGKAKTLR